MRSAAAPDGVDAPGVSRRSPSLLLLPFKARNGRVGAACSGPGLSPDRRETAVCCKRNAS